MCLKLKGIYKLNGFHTDTNIFKTIGYSQTLNYVSNILKCWWYPLKSENDPLGEETGAKQFQGFPFPPKKKTHSSPVSQPKDWWILEYHKQTWYVAAPNHSDPWRVVPKENDRLPTFETFEGAIAVCFRVSFLGVLWFHRAKDRCSLLTTWNLWKQGFWAWGIPTKILGSRCHKSEHKMYVNIMMYINFILTKKHAYQ